MTDIYESDPPVQTEIRVSLLCFGTAGLSRPVAFWEIVVKYGKDGLWKQPAGRPAPILEAVIFFPGPSSSDQGQMKSCNVNAHIQFSYPLPSC